MTVTVTVRLQWSLQVPSDNVQWWLQVPSHDVHWVNDDCKCGSTPGYWAKELGMVVHFPSLDVAKIIIPWPWPWSCPWPWPWPWPWLCPWPWRCYRILTFPMVLVWISVCQHIVTCERLFCRHLIQKRRCWCCRREKACARHSKKMIATSNWFYKRKSSHEITTAYVCEKDYKIVRSLPLIDLKETISSWKNYHVCMSERLQYREIAASHWFGRDDFVMKELPCMYVRKITISWDRCLS